MRVYQKECQRLNQAEAFVKSSFPHFGINKKQEVIRLLYEISKREGVLPSEIVAVKERGDYDVLKKELLGKRYPLSSLGTQALTPHLPKIGLKASEGVSLKKKKFSPQNIFTEKKAAGSRLVTRLKNVFPQARFTEIGSLKEYIRDSAPFTVEKYNKRQDTLFIVNENYDFFKGCPCTCAALHCGYHLFNLGFGCIYECSYCFLQGYTNSPGIILTENIDAFFKEFSAYKRRGLRLGTGEFSDSLALDAVTEYSIPLVEFFRKQEEVSFEFKTKSTMIENLLAAPSGPNIVISWSVNPQEIIEENEFFTPSLEERLLAAQKCAAAGYRVGFHFDPIIYFPGWEKHYASVIENIFSRIKPKDIAWISLGTFRFSPGLKQVIERRFPTNKILDAELLLGYDNKLRYPYGIRYEIYRKILAQLRHYSREVNRIYLCMEEIRMWKDLNLQMPSFAANA